MSDLEELIRDAALDYAKPGGIILLVGETTTHIGVHGLSDEDVVTALGHTLDYFKAKVNKGTSAGRILIIRR